MPEQPDGGLAPGLALQVVLPPYQLEALAERVAHLLHRDEGFLDAVGAAEYLGLTRKAVYALVERGKLPHHRPAGRLLFDRATLRAWVEGDRMEKLDSAGGLSNMRPTTQMGGHRANGPAPSTRRIP